MYTKDDDYDYGTNYKPFSKSSIILLILLIFSVFCYVKQYYEIKQLKAEKQDNEEYITMLMKACK